MLLSLVVCSTVSCSNEDEDYMIWDFAPIVLRVSVQDAAGNDLLDPATENSIAHSGIKAIYKENIYEKDSVIDRGARYYLAHFYGLYSYKPEKGNYILTFGEFNGDDTFKNETVILDWNDGTKDIISFDSQLIWLSKNKPKIIRTFYLNGKETENPMTIIKN